MEASCLAVPEAAASIVRQRVSPPTVTQVKPNSVRLNISNSSGLVEGENLGDGGDMTVRVMVIQKTEACGKKRWIARSSKRSIAAASKGR